MAVTVLPRPGSSPLGRLLVELRTAGSDVLTQARASRAALRAGHAWARALVALWTIGTVGDAVTTLLMMRTGRFEEANGSAALLMGHLGTQTWVLVSSLVCAGLATLTLARPRTTYAWTAAAVAVLVCLGKLHATAGNALLWWASSR